MEEDKKSCFTINGRRPEQLGLFRLRGNGKRFWHGTFERNKLFSETNKWRLVDLTDGFHELQNVLLSLWCSDSEWFASMPSGLGSTLMVFVAKIQDQSIWRLDRSSPKICNPTQNCQSLSVVRFGNLNLAQDCIFCVFRGTQWAYIFKWMKVEIIKTSLIITTRERQLSYHMSFMLTHTCVCVGGGVDCRESDDPQTKYQLVLVLG